MNYYPFHLGDYRAHTAHLTPTEDLIYRRLIDQYYLAEAPLPLDTATLARLIGMRDHTEIVDAIVSEFFTKGDGGWFSKRCEEEIAKYKARANRASKLAEKRWHPTEKPCDVVCVSDTTSIANHNHNQLDTNLKTKRVAPAPVEVKIPEAIDTSEFRKAWQAYNEYRKVMKMKTLKPASIVILLEKLATWGESAAIESINTTISNGWQGLFEPKPSSAAKPIQQVKPESKSKFINAW